VGKRKFALREMSGKGSIVIPQYDDVRPYYAGFGEWDRVDMPNGGSKGGYQDT